jgi:hypothetical protein
MVKVGEHVTGGALIHARDLDKSYHRGSEEMPPAIRASRANVATTLRAL